MEIKFAAMFQSTHNGNLGAKKVLSLLMEEVPYKCYDYVKYLYINKITGMDLWVYYKNIHKEDIKSVIEDIKLNLRKDNIKEFI